MDDLYYFLKQFFLFNFLFSELCQKEAFNYMWCIKIWNKTIFLNSVFTWNKISEEINFFCSINWINLIWIVSKFGIILEKIESTQISYVIFDWIDSELVQNSFGMFLVQNNWFDPKFIRFLHNFLTRPSHQNFIHNWLKRLSNLDQLIWVYWKM